MHALTLYSPVVTIFTTDFNIKKKLFISRTRYNYVFSTTITKVIVVPETVGPLRVKIC